MGDEKPLELQSSRSLVVHLLPADMSRGAQSYAYAVRDRLDGSSTRHVVLTLYGATDIDVADSSLGLKQRSGLLRRFDPKVVVGLRRTLRELEPDVVVAHGGEPLKYAAFSARRHTRLVYLKIGTSRTQLANPIRRFAYRMLVKRADAVVGVSSEMVTEAAELLDVSRTRLAYVPNGRDPALFRPRAHGDGPPVRLVFVGHITRTKRPQRFIEIVRSLRSEGIEVTANMVGGGPLTPSLSAEARDAGVEMLGTRRDVPELLGESDVFVFTSTVEGEGMPGVLIEAGLAGLPSVATAVPGASDVIDDGETGFIVPVDDLGAQIDAVRLLVESPELRSRMGAAARLRCEERFSLDASAEAFGSVIESLISRSPI